MTPTASLPFSTPDLPGIGGRIRAVPEDFEVDEVPAYPFSGEGPHTLVRIEKRGLTTPEAVRRLAAAAGFDARAAGWAGYKDRHAVTRQWISVEGLDPDRARGAAADGVRVLEVSRHQNRLKSGHLAGNRFVVLVREAQEDGRAAAIAARLEQDGLANFYGEQRFGRDGDNADRARAFLTGRSRPPRDPGLRRLLASAWQSALFNRALVARLERGGHSCALAGDLCTKEDTGGMFWDLDAAALQRRLDAHEISITGPLFGARMRWPEGEARGFEEAVLAAELEDPSVLRAHKNVLPGGRRAYRVLPGKIEIAATPDGVRLAFTLPAGSYATVLLREVCKTEVAGDVGLGQDSSGPDGSPHEDVPHQ